MKIFHCAFVQTVIPLDGIPYKESILLSDTLIILDYYKRSTQSISLIHTFNVYNEAYISFHVLFSNHEK